VYLRRVVVYLREADSCEANVIRMRLLMPGKLSAGCALAESRRRTRVK
jgi:hypothetical protein